MRNFVEMASSDFVFPQIFNKKISKMEKSDGGRRVGRGGGGLQFTNIKTQN